MPTYAVWQYWLWSFQTGGTQLQRFLPKNQHTQRELLNFEYWISEGLRSFLKKSRIGWPQQPQTEKVLKIYIIKSGVCLSVCGHYDVWLISPPVLKLRDTQE